MGDEVVGDALLAAPRYLPETERRPGQLDAAGAISSTLGMTALVYGIVRSADAGWTDALSLTALAAGVLLLALFVVNEKRAAHPVMPLAGGVTNVAHQLGGSLGLGILVAVFAGADSTTLNGTALLAHRIAASLTVAAGLLAWRSSSRWPSGPEGP